MSTVDTDPSVLFGGTWAAYAQGRTIIGTGTSDREFPTGQTGGESSHMIGVGEMPAHGHFHTPQGSLGSHDHSYSPRGSINNISMTGELCGGGQGGYANGICSLVGGAGIPKQDGNVYEQMKYKVNASHSHTFTGTSGWTGNSSGTFTGTRSKSEDEGGGAAISLLQPYIVTHIWTRTA